MFNLSQNKSLLLGKLIAFSLLIILVFNSVVILQSKQNYMDAIAATEANGLRLVRIMEQQIELTFSSTDSTLERAVEQQYFSTLFGNAKADNLNDNLQKWVNESPHIAAMVVVDAHGRASTYSFKKQYSYITGYADHVFTGDDIFVTLRKGLDTDSFVGKLPLESIPSRNLIVMGRKITQVNGEFGGIMIAVLDPEFFTTHFQQLDKGVFSYISLQLINNGTLLAASKNYHNNYSQINQHALAALKKGKQDQGITVKTTELNGFIIDMYAFQKIASLPVMVTVILNEDDYLKNWRDTLVNDLLFLGIFIIFSSMLTYFVITLARHIARAKQSEAVAVLASQTKSQFLTHMSHELRTPLNAIIGFSEMIVSGYFGEINAKQNERIHDINLCGTHLLQLITDMLEFSKGNAGKLELVEEPLEMNDIMKEALRIMSQRIKSKHIDVVTDVRDNLPLLLGDKRKIRQILLNLLSNSLKFTSEGGTITVSISQNNNSSQVMTVKDTGIGIAQKDIPVALSVFGQVTRNQTQEGTGLGLPLCKMFAELHSAQFILTSELGAGTSVQIIFPDSRNCSNATLQNENPLAQFNEIRLN